MHSCSFFTSDKMFFVGLSLSITGGSLIGASKTTSLKIVATAGFVFGFLYQFLPCLSEMRHNCQAGLVPAGASIYGVVSSISALLGALLMRGFLYSLQKNS